MIRAFGVAAALLALSYPTTEAAGPPPIRGVALAGPTGLRLLVANNPPFVLDVDGARVTPIEGLAIRGRAVVSVQKVGRYGVIWVDDRAPSATVPQASIFVLRPGERVARHVTEGWEVAGSADSRGLWIKAYVSPARCVLREVDFRGRRRRPPRRLPCKNHLLAAGRPIVAKERTATDPETGRVLLRRTGLWVLAGRFALSSSTSPRRLLVTDLQSRRSWPLPWPSNIDGRDEFAAQPHGSRLVLAFADPAYQGGGSQVMDAWELDVPTRSLEHVPDMPSSVSLKSTSLAVATDGRLVLLAESGGRRLIALWRRGQERLAVRTLRLPVQNAGSDSFVVW